MCFSAKASFISAGIITAVGAATLKKAKKRQLLLAFIPLLFAIQQFAEGIIWLSDANSITGKISTYIFLFFATVIWPTYTPMAILAIEPNQKRKKIQKILLGMGITISLTLLISLIILPVSFQIWENNIEYTATSDYFPIHLKYIGLGLYAIATIGSCLSSSHKIMRFFGATLILSLAISLYFFLKTYGSVWCFFAAALSLIIYLHIRSKNKS